MKNLIFNTFILIDLLLVAVPAFINADNINVHTISELVSNLEKVSAGDVIILADGNYNGFTVTKSGTSSDAITIKAANVGKAVINHGVVNLSHVSYVTIDGLMITSSGGEVSVDSTTRHAGISLVNSNNCRITRCTFNLNSPPKNTFWVTIGGASNNNQVDHNEFGPYTGSNRQIYIWPTGDPNISGVTNPHDRTAWAHGKGPKNPNIARGTHIHHNYFHNKASGTSEVIILGGLGMTGDYQDTKSIVEHNLFVDCDGDPEIISIKSSSNEIRFNTIRTSNGVISSRAGNNNSIHSNFILAAGKGGGIKIQEMNIKVYNNYIDHTDKSSYPIMIENGDSYNSTSFTHAQVVNAIISHNTVINPGREVLIGHGGRTLTAKDSVFANNIIMGSGNLYTESGTPTNFVRSHNIISQHSGSLSGFAIEDPKLKLSDGIYKIESGSPAIGAADSKYDPYVTDDIDGQPRKANDIGADEFSSAPVTNKPLTASDVGPKSGGGV